MLFHLHLSPTMYDAFSPHNSQNSQMRGNVIPTADRLFTMKERITCSDSLYCLKESHAPENKEKHLHGLLQTISEMCFHIKLGMTSLWRDQSAPGQILGCTKISCTNVCNFDIPNLKSSPHILWLLHKVTGTGGLDTKLGYQPSPSMQVSPSHIPSSLPKSPAPVGWIS